MFCRLSCPMVFAAAVDSPMSNAFGRWLLLPVFSIDFDMNHTILFLASKIALASKLAASSFNIKYWCDSTSNYSDVIIVIRCCLAVGMHSLEMQCERNADRADIPNGRENISYYIRQKNVIVMIVSQSKRSAFGVNRFSVLSWPVSMASQEGQLKISSINLRLEVLAEVFVERTVCDWSTVIRVIKMKCAKEMENFDFTSSQIVFLQWTKPKIRSRSKRENRYLSMVSVMSRLCWTEFDWTKKWFHKCSNETWINRVKCNR